MRTVPLMFTGLLALSLAAPAFAHKAHDHSHDKHHAHEHKHDHDHGSDSLGAHQHGVAQLNLVIEGSRVEIELDSPADNLVGFEYIPTREEDLAKVRAAYEQLQDASSLFRFPDAAQCSQEDATLNSPLFTALDKTGHSHDHQHGEAHDASAHNDIEAQYRFECGNPAALDRIEVVLFERFPATERLVLQAISEKGQQGGELTAAQNVIRF
jgi:hypothetical protein